YYSEEEETHIEEIDVSNDYIHFTWIVDKSLNKSLTSLRIMAATMKGIVVMTVNFRRFSMVVLRSNFFRQY
uniref:GOLD domain-containing protein n=1 Tax=Ascaris lumbricoides TaxID=6252 RepID=A0A0M3HJQ9_ASCLU